MTELNTSNIASQDLTYNKWYTRGILQKSLHGHEWSVIKPLGILGSEVALESKWKIFKWTATRTRGGGRNKSQGGIQQQDVVRYRSPIKWSTPLPLMATFQTQHVREERWKENWLPVVVVQVLVVA